MKSGSENVQGFHWFQEKSLNKFNHLMILSTVDQKKKSESTVVRIETRETSDCKMCSPGLQMIEINTLCVMFFCLLAELSLPIAKHRWHKKAYSVDCQFSLYEKNSEN